MPAAIEARLFALIGVESGDPEAEIASRLGDDEIDVDLFERLIAANQAWGTATGDRIVANLTAFLAAPPLWRQARLADLGSGLVTAKGEPCKVKAKQLAAEPDYDALVARVRRLADRSFAR